MDEGRPGDVDRRGLEPAAVDYAEHRIDEFERQYEYDGFTRPIDLEEWVDWNSAADATGAEAARLASRYRIPKDRAMHVIRKALWAVDIDRVNAVFAAKPGVP